MTVRVLVADDEHLVRAGYRMIFQGEPDIQVVGEAADGVEAVEVSRRLRPDVVLMDVRMPRLDGIAATRAITRGPDGPAVVVVTTFDLDEYVFRALQAGAVGFLLKDAPERQLLDALRTAPGGMRMLSPAVTLRLVAKYAATAAPPYDQTTLGALTEREREVLALVARGRSNADIASTLVIGETTVKTHVSRILSKLGLASRTQAAVVAYESGLVRAAN